MQKDCDKCICKKCEEHGPCDSCNYCISEEVKECDNYIEVKRGD